MRDPHVERLHYTVGSGSETISYQEPAPLSVTNELGTFELREGTAMIVPAEHFATEDEARRAIEPFLRAWEVATDLADNPGTVRFKFIRAEIIDRSPPPAGPPQTVQATGVGTTVMLGAPTVRIACHKYPQPPSAFRSTTDVELAHRRWFNFRSGKEPLQSMAYFVLTLLERRAGGRREAAEVFSIDYEVLNKVGYLCSAKGDALTARKVDASFKFQEHTGGESSWLEQAVRRLIMRLGEHASGVPQPIIRINDLPDL